MKEILTFNDTLIVPKFSSIKSRKDVDLRTKLAGQILKLPVISSNMDTVTESAMAKAMNKAGGVGCLHRFMSIEDNIRMFKESECNSWVSFGLGSKELERVETLYHHGANTFVLDVAHGANTEVVKQMKEVFNLVGSENANFVVGNFGEVNEVKAFNEYLGKPITYKVGIGGGSACTTRIETGCGYPTLGAVLSCKDYPFEIIADGGLKTPGDVAKAIAAGAKAVMLGGMLSGTDESPGESFYKLDKVLYTEKEFERICAPNSKWGALGMTKENFIKDYNVNVIKTYRGSASKESYEVQGKDEGYRTAEGESFTVPYKGSVTTVLSRIEGGLRSAYSYVGASTTEEFQRNADLIRISNAGYKEGTPHGKTNY